MIAGSIVMMEELDVVAKKILKANGIEKFSEDKWYPREIHSNILEEVRKKLGESALIAIGFSTSKIIDSFVSTELQDYSEKILKIDERENRRCPVRS